jgi:hypothetical protein
MPPGYGRSTAAETTDILWSVALSPDDKTLAFVGFKGVDAALLLLPVGE